MSVLMNLIRLLQVFLPLSISTSCIQSVADSGCRCCVLTEKIREFNKFAIKRGSQEFSNEDISLVERLVVDNQYCSAATDVLWRMLQWPSGRSDILLMVLPCS